VGPSLLLRKDPGNAWAYAELDGLRKYLLVAAEEGHFTPDPKIPFTAEVNENLFNSLRSAYSDLCLK
jgi:hypothetical protein